MGAAVGPVLAGHRRGHLEPRTAIPILTEFRKRQCIRRVVDKESDVFSSGGSSTWLMQACLYLLSNKDHLQITVGECGPTAIPTATGNASTTTRPSRRHQHRAHPAPTWPRRRIERPAHTARRAVRDGRKGAPPPRPVPAALAAPPRSPAPRPRAHPLPPMRLVHSMYPLRLRKSSSGIPPPRRGGAGAFWAMQAVEEGGVAGGRQRVVPR